VLKERVLDELVASSTALFGHLDRVHSLRKSKQNWLPDIFRSFHASLIHSNALQPILVQVKE
jgi:hypothetical protein